MRKEQNEDPLLSKIRHYKGSLQDVIDYWKKKHQLKIDPHKGKILQYPKKKIVKNSIPYQTFESHRFMKFNEFIKDN